MNLRIITCILLATILPGLLAVSCESIMVSPTCPATLRVGESGMVHANEQTPGAIARYQWQLDPPELGNIQNPTAKDTSFQALAEGTVNVWLTASDGLFVDTGQCTVTIRGIAELAVSLSASPIDPLVGEPVTLTCTSIGATEAVIRTITPISGQIVMLNPVSEGVVRFEADEPGELVFECIGKSTLDAVSGPSRLTVTVLESLTDNENGNINGNLNSNANANGNANSNTNSNVNSNDNTPANGNANLNDNQSANANANSNDNGSIRPGK